MPIAKEAWRYLFIVFACAVMVNITISFWVALVLWTVLLALLYLCRDPTRVIPSVPLAVVSPVDGRVLLVEKVSGTSGRTRVLIKMGMHDAYVLRSPTEGKLTKRWEQSEWPMGQQVQCEHLGFGVSIMTDAQDEIILFIRGHRMFPMKCDMTLGERIGQGQKCGFSPFGACIEVMILTSARMQVKTGDQVLGGESILGTLRH